MARSAFVAVSYTMMNHALPNNLSYVEMSTVLSIQGGQEAHH